MTAGGTREPCPQGKGSLSWSESTTTDVWPGGSTICSPAGGRSPNPWTMVPAPEWEGLPCPGLRQDRRVPPGRRFPQSRKNPETFDPSRVPPRSPAPAFFLTQRLRNFGEVMIAAIYVRTSTLRQGEEGTSLETKRSNPG